MERAIPVFWKHGFNGTSLQDLEKATAVNKSGLYSEFKDKEDLFLCSLKHYMANLPVFAILERQPLGWENIEAYLNMGQTCDGRKGCFLVNTVRELSDLPPSARRVMADHMQRMRDAIAANARAAKSRLDPEALADMVITFHTGMSLQQNYGVEKAEAAHRIQNFLSTLKR